MFTLRFIHRCMLQNEDQITIFSIFFNLSAPEGEAGFTSATSQRLVYIWKCWYVYLKNPITTFTITKLMIHIAVYGCCHLLPSQEQGRPCSWTCSTPAWRPLVKRGSTSTPSCWTFIKVSSMPLTVTGPFQFILYIFSFPSCPDVPPEIVFHYACR